MVCCRFYLGSDLRNISRACLICYSSSLSLSLWSSLWLSLWSSLSLSVLVAITEISYYYYVVLNDLNQKVWWQHKLSTSPRHRDRSSIIVYFAMMMLVPNKEAGPTRHFLQEECYYLCSDMVSRTNLRWQLNRLPVLYRQINVIAIICFLPVSKLAHPSFKAQWLIGVC